MKLPDWVVRHADRASSIARTISPVGGRRPAGESRAPPYGTGAE